MKRAVHLFPSLSDQTGVEAVRSKYDPLCGKIPPHITLVFPFENDLTNEALIAHVQVQIQNHRGFDLTFGPPEIRGEYLWLPVHEGREQIQALHDDLYTGDLKRHLSASRAYIPHLTLARVSDDSMDAAYVEARDIGPGIKARIGCIVIERILADDSSDLLATLPLG